MWLVYFPEGIYVDKPLSRPHELMLLKFLHGHENILLANGHKIIYKLGIIKLPVQFSVQSFFFHVDRDFCGLSTREATNRCNTSWQ